MEAWEPSRHRDVSARFTRGRLRPWKWAAALPAIVLVASCTRLDSGPPIVAARSTVTASRAAQADSMAVWPSSRRIKLGRSVEGVPLILEVFGDGPDRVFIFGGIHGDEPTSAGLARRLAEYLRIQPGAFAGRTVGILAEANPDGLARRQRCNASGVDLNRNFPARNWRRARGNDGQHGSRPASEPETRAIMRAMELIRPDRILSIHAARGGRHCNNYDGPAKGLVELMAATNHYPVRASMGYPTPGSFGSWAGIDRHISTVTLELPRDLSGAASWRANRAALLAFVQTPGATTGN